jgi:hypothetical protein
MTADQATTGLRHLPIGPWAGLGVLAVCSCRSVMREQAPQSDRGAVRRIGIVDHVVERNDGEGVSSFVLSVGGDKVGLVVERRT